MILSKNNKLGALVDQKIVIPFEYDKILIEYFGYLCTKYNEHHEPISYLYNNQFKLISEKDIFIESSRKASKNILIMADEDDLFYLLTDTGEALTPHIYKSIIDIAENAFIFKTQNDLYFIGDKFGNKLSSLYKEIDHFLYKAKTITNKWSLINKKYEAIAEEQDSIERLGGNSFLCTKDDKSQIIDATGKVAIDFSKDIAIKSIRYYTETSLKENNEYAILFNKDNENNIAVDLSHNKIITVGEFTDFLYVDSKTATMVKDKKIFFINLLTQEKDTSFESYKIKDYLYYFIVLEKDNLCCLINRQGKIILPLEYDSIFSLTDNYGYVVSDLYIVKKNKKVGIVNLQNEIIIPIENNYIGSESYYAD